MYKFQGLFYQNKKYLKYQKIAFTNQSFWHIIIGINKRMINEDKSGFSRGSKKVYT